MENVNVRLVSLVLLEWQKCVSIFQFRGTKTLRVANGGLGDNSARSFFIEISTKAQRVWCLWFDKG